MGAAMAPVDRWMRRQIPSLTQAEATLTNSEQICFSHSLISLRKQLTWK